MVGISNAATISYTAFETISANTNDRVWKDNRLRAYDDTYNDIYGFMLFDISTLDDNINITGMTLTTYHEAGYGNPHGDPDVEILYSTNDNWSRSTASGFIGGIESTLSTNNNSFPFEDNIPYTWSIDITAHDWSVDLADNFITLAMNQTTPGYNYVYWNGSDNPDFAPKIEIEYTMASVPEPSTAILLGFGLVGFAGVSRKRLKK